MAESDYPVGDRLVFNGEPHPETGALRHLGQDGEVHVLAGAADGGHPLAIGSIGEVRAFVPAEVDGAGSHDADCWVLRFPYESAAEAYLDADGNPQKREGVIGFRHISFEAEQLAAWFSPAPALEPVAEPV